MQLSSCALPTHHQAAQAARAATKVSPLSPLILSACKYSYTQRQCVVAILIEAEQSLENKQNKGGGEVLLLGCAPRRREGLHPPRRHANKACPSSGPPIDPQGARAACRTLPAGPCGA